MHALCCAALLAIVTALAWAAPTSSANAHQQLATVPVNPPSTSTASFATTDGASLFAVNIDPSNEAAWQQFTAL